MAEQTISMAADQKATDGPNGFAHLTKSQLIATIIGLQLTLLLAALDQTIVSTAMPRIIAQLNGFDRYTWATAAYLLTSTAAVPIFGRMSDIYGRKWFLLAGAFFFILTSALCGASGQIPGIPWDGMSQLIIFRGLQGIAGGIIMAVVFTVIGDLFAPADRGKYMGLFSAVWALASMTGPALGGWLTDQFSWRSIFYVNLPVGAVALAVLYFAFPYVKPHGVQKNIDYLGAASLIAFLVPLLVGLTLANTELWNSPRVLGLLTFSLIMLFIFYQVEQRAIEPIMPPSLLRIANVRVSVLGLCCLSAGMFDVGLFAPLFMQAVLGISATQTGSLLVPYLLTMSFSAASSGQLISRLGRYKILATIGSGALILGLLLLATLHATTSPQTVVCILFIIGAGLGLAMPVYTVLVQNAAPPNMIGAATGMSQFWRSIGATLGAAVLGAIMQARYLEHLHSCKLPVLPDFLSRELQNPAHLVHAKQDLLAALGNGARSTQLIEVVSTQVSDALVYSLDGVFLLGALIVVIAFVASFYIDETPLRSR